MAAQILGQAVVLGEVPRRCAVHSELALEAAGGFFRDVFVERTRPVSRLKDSQDGLVAERSEAEGVPERRVDILGGVTLAQEQDAPGAVAPLARGCGAEPPKELCGVLAHLLEGRANLIEVDGRASAITSMETLRIDLQATSSWSELVGCNALEIGGVHEELALGDAYGEQIGDVVVGNGVAICLPVDKAVDVAEAIGDAGGVIAVARKRHQMGRFFREALKGRGGMTLADVDDGGEPLGKLGVEVAQVTKLPARKK